PPGEQNTRNPPDLSGGGKWSTTWSIVSGSDEGQGQIKVMVQGTVRYVHRPSTTTNNQEVYTGEKTSALEIDMDAPVPAGYGSAGGNMGFAAILALLIGIPLLVAGMRPVLPDVAGKAEASIPYAARKYVRVKILATILIFIGVMQIILMLSSSASLDRTAGALLVPFTTILAAWANPNYIAAYSGKYSEELRMWLPAMMILVALGYLLASFGMV
ncbi:MAG: hypothetical protein QCI38_06865, partial [Candidatus Thermoplasmatota archaeon]|nr:hypothetical protein [Candidatus Thermoplasmatota archaeon]